MRIIKIIVYLGVFTLVIKSCIKPFTPDIEDSNNIIVINGTLTNEEGFQYAQVSWASSFNEQSYKPVNNCDAKIIDGMGNIFNMINYGDGKYKTWIDQEYLNTGNIFKIEVTLENGKKYISDYDTLLPCPEIDSIYYEKITIESDNPIYSSTEAVQFYIDFNLSAEYARNYRWTIEETWEYHVPFLHIFAFYEYNDSLDSLGIFLLEEPIDSLSKCWKTNKIKDIYTYTTHKKKGEKVNALSLNVTTNDENRLSGKYSILIKQHTLSDIAFNYWNHLQKQSKETGGLYESQPYRLKGNIKSVDDENETVLGIFSVSTVKTKRFINDFDFELKIDENCEVKITDQDELFEFLDKSNPETYPIYLYYYFSPNEPNLLLYYEQTCFDCRLKGGTIRKPDYW